MDWLKDVVRVAGRSRPLCRSSGGSPLNVQLPRSYWSRCARCEESTAKDVIFDAWIGSPSTSTPAKSTRLVRLIVNAVDAVILIVGREEVDDSSCWAMTRSNGRATAE